MTPALARAVKQTLQFWAAEARGDLPPLLVFRRSGIDIKNRFNFTIRHLPYDAPLATLHGLGFTLEEHFLFGRGVREGQRALRSANLPVPVEPVANWKARSGNLQVRDHESREIVVENWIGARYLASVWQGDARLNFAGVDAAFADKHIALAIGNELALGRAPPSGFHLGEATYRPTVLTQRVEMCLAIGQDRIRSRITDDEAREWATTRAW